MSPIQRQWSIFLPLFLKKWENSSKFAFRRTFERKLYNKLKGSKHVKRASWGLEIHNIENHLMRGFKVINVKKTLHAKDNVMNAPLATL